jgi:hypothetical protein
MPTEKLNLHLRSTVDRPNEEDITRAVEQFNFTGPVGMAFNNIMKHNREAAKPKTLRSITRTVNAVKQFLYDKLIYKGVCGPLQAHELWATFVAPSTNCLIQPDLSNRTTPWKKAYEAMIPPAHGPNSTNEGYQEFLRRHLDTRVTW